MNNNSSCLSKESSFSAIVSPITVIFTFMCLNTDDGPFISEDFMKSACLTHCYICLGNAFLPDGTRPLPQPTLTNHMWRLGHLQETAFTGITQDISSWNGAMRKTFPYRDVIMIYVMGRNVTSDITETFFRRQVCLK